MLNDIYLVSLQLMFEFVPILNQYVIQLLIFCFNFFQHLTLSFQSLSETLDDQYGDSEGWETGLSELNNGGLN